MSGSCPDCGLPLLDHLSADECEAHGIDAGLRDGLGCAVVTRIADRGIDALTLARLDLGGPGDEAAIARESIADLAHEAHAVGFDPRPSDCDLCLAEAEREASR